MTEKEGGESLDLVTFDRLDDELIIAELQGRAVQTWAYSFRQDNQEISGLSIGGVEQACRESGRRGEAIRVLRHEWRETEDAVFATVEAGRFLIAADGREILTDTTIGAKAAPKRKWSNKKRGWYNDPFVFETAISKAARNAKSKLLDDRLKAETLAAALKAGRTRQVDKKEVVAAKQAADREDEPPSAEDVRADEARRRFFKIAEGLGLLEHGAIHAAIGLKCHGEGPHGDDDPGACHRLSAGLRYLASQGKSTAEAWEVMIARLPAELLETPFENGTSEVNADQPPLPEAE